MTTIQVRTDKNLKKDAMRVFKELGLDMSTAVNMFLVQVKLRKAIPFEIRTENGLTPTQEKNILKELAWARKNGKRYASGKALLKDMMGQ